MNDDTTASAADLRDRFCSHVDMSALQLARDLVSLLNRARELGFAVCPDVDSDGIAYSVAWAFGGVSRYLDVEWLPNTSEWTVVHRPGKADVLADRLPSRNDIEADATTHHPEVHHEHHAPDPAVPNPQTVTEVVAAIHDDIGSSGLGQLGKEGLSDMIWKHHTPFHALNADQRQAWLNAVCEELGWAPWS